MIRISSASGGQLIQTYSLCARLWEALPECWILLSRTSARSFGFARRVPGAYGVFFSPWDLPRPVRRALKTLGPRLVLAMEAALDPILYCEAERLGATAMLASGYMTNRYHSHPTDEYSTALGVFGHSDWIGAKSEEDRWGFLDLGVPPERVMVPGDLRYDAEYLEVPETERARWREVLGLAPGETLLVAVNVRAGGEEIVIDGFFEARRGLTGFRLLVAPRFPREVELVVAAIRSRGEELHRGTELRGGPSGGVLILDSFGELPRLYSLASFVFLGGSLVPADSAAALGQNLIEPLAQGAPVFFGPHMSRWDEIARPMTGIYPGLRVTGAGHLARGILELDRKPEVVSGLRALAQQLMQERSGGLREHVGSSRNS